MASEVPYLSVVIPSYNETENLKNGVLGEVASYLKTQKYSWEVIVSDDGSPDIESQRLARAFCEENSGFRYLGNAHAGKPFAVWAGVQATKGEIILFTDMDQSTPIRELEKLLPYYAKGFDVVIGSRGVERKNSSVLRTLASGIFREFRRTLLLREIIDTQAGFKSFRREVGLKVFPKLQIIKMGPPKNSGWKVTSFDVEMLFIAELLGYKITEVPVAWENRDLAMASKKSNTSSKFFKESMDMLKQIFRVKINYLRGMYK